MARENRSYKIKEVIDLVEYAIENLISSQQWQAAMAHVRKIENEYWEVDQVIPRQDPLVIIINPDSDSSSAESEKEKQTNPRLNSNNTCTSPPTNSVSVTASNSVANTCSNSQHPNGVGIANQIFTV